MLPLFVHPTKSSPRRVAIVFVFSCCKPASVAQGPGLPHETQFMTQQLGCKIQQRRSIQESSAQGFLLVLIPVKCCTCDLLHKELDPCGDCLHAKRKVLHHNPKNVSAWLSLKPSHTESNIRPAGDVLLFFGSNSTSPRNMPWSFVQCGTLFCAL